MAPANDLPIALAMPMNRVPGVPLSDAWPLNDAAHQDIPKPERWPFLFPCNRVRAVALHVPWYGFELRARLAYDAGLSRSTVSRLIGGRSQASLPVALRLAGVLSWRLKQRLPAVTVLELFSFDGTYPTASACSLCGCGGCLPPEAYDDFDCLKPAWKHAEPGDWSLAPSKPFGSAPARTV